MIVSSVAAPAVISIAVEVTLPSSVALKLNVRGPAVPVIDRSVNVARPVPLVVAVVVPASVPPPAAIAAVTTTPLSLTGFPDPSCSWIAGCCANVAPL